jgi:hypothetical protein
MLKISIYSEAIFGGHEPVTEAPETIFSSNSGRHVGGKEMLVFVVIRLDTEPPQNAAYAIDLPSYFRFRLRLGQLTAHPGLVMGFVHAECWSRVLKLTMSLHEDLYISKFCF